MKNFLERVWPGDSCRSDGCRCAVIMTCTATLMGSPLHSDVVAVVASHCDPPTLAMLCRTAYCIRDVAQPHLYRRVFISSFSRAASFFAAMSKGPPSLAKMVLTYSESSNARMPHLVTPEFAKNVARSLYRMSDSLEALRLAHSVQALHELNESVVASLMRLRRLRIVDLHEYPTSARGLAAPNTSLTDLRLSGEDERGNSTSVPAPHFVRRLVYQSYEDLQVLRLTVCSMADVVEACKGITWQRVHTLGLDDCVIPEMFTVVFPGLVTLELWARRHEEKHVPVQGWQRLSMLECVVGCIGRHRASTPPNTHNGLRVVAKLAVRSTGPEPVSFDKVTSAISCVVREKLEQLRVGYIGDRGALPALFGLADGVYNLVLELRMREARDPVRSSLVRCPAAS